MGRPKGEPTEMIRVPSAMVGEIRALIRERAAKPVAEVAAPAGKRTRVKPEALTARAKEIEAKVMAGVAQAGRGELTPMEGSIHFTARTTIGADGVKVLSDVEVVGWQCPQCTRVVPSSRYRGRQHAASCSKFDRAIA